MEEVKDYLVDLEEELILTPASAGLRFANYLIDIIVYYAIVFIAGMIMSPFIMSMETGGEYGSNGFEFASFFIALGSYFLYYFLMEGATKGKTVGKLITGTRAISNDGTPITWKQAAIRTLIRFIPFEVFSTFGGFPWHDTWAQTITIKDRK